MGRQVTKLGFTITKKHVLLFMNLAERRKNDELNICQDIIQS